MRRATQTGGRTKKGYCCNNLYIDSQSPSPESLLLVIKRKPRAGFSTNTFASTHNMHVRVVLLNAYTDKCVLPGYSFVLRVLEWGGRQ